MRQKVQKVMWHLVPFGIRKGHNFPDIFSAKILGKFCPKIKYFDQISEKKWTNFLSTKSPFLGKKDKKQFLKLF